MLSLLIGRPAGARDCGGGAGDDGRADKGDGSADGAVEAGQDGRPRSSPGTFIHCIFRLVWIIVFLLFGCICAFIVVFNC